MDKGPRAKELALEAATLAFFLVALAGLAAGAEAYVAALRGLGAAALVAFGSRFPIRVALEALAPPAHEPPQGKAESAPAEAPARKQRAA
jgi:hypothetical protein